jgi:hypothetical protein
MLQANCTATAHFSEHAIAVNDLPRLRKDPFDRILLAQARVEGLGLLTIDKVLAEYGDPVRRVCLLPQLTDKDRARLKGKDIFWDTVTFTDYHLPVCAGAPLLVSRLIENYI